MKKLVILSFEDINYVKEIAKEVSDTRAKNGNFSKGLSKIIQDHKNGRQIQSC